LYPHASTAWTWNNSALQVLVNCTCWDYVLKLNENLDNLDNRLEHFGWFYYLDQLLNSYLKLNETDCASLLAQYFHLLVPRLPKQNQFSFDIVLLLKRTVECLSYHVSYKLDRKENLCKNNSHCKIDCSVANMKKK
jgi:hypothetical protein